LELLARIILTKKWGYNKKYDLTHHTSSRGRYASHPYLPYVLRPNYKSQDNHFTHNAYGFRGKPFQIKKPQFVKRIVALGASSTYGIWVPDKKTYPAQLRQLFKENGIENVEVLNAAVPGWTSMETFINFHLRVQNLRPDMIIFYQGRNDIFPQAFNNFRSDYQHYRKPDYSFRYTNYFHRYLFRLSNAFLIMSYSDKGRFGLSRLEENPAYGSINYENRPDSNDMVHNLSDNGRLDVYRNNLESIIQLALSKNIVVIVSTFAFLKDRYGSGVIPKNRETLPRIEKQIMSMNEIIREVAELYDVTLVDTDSELHDRLPELLVDDCHFNEKGQIARAKLIYKHIESRFQTNN